ncbi:hypothetical protein [Sediminibacterium goheungense]|uniref:Uncharacterized protein n=1 Tax=Sediminibacterium goheungense TaxID=1086393 RepID=A0A4R6ISN0_9BACT|nr:hypothetical protein [Sediminibacterium goheungense]TDO25494.1 hypothetical protein BC659_3036 [Sediminibacterium goheungense]
MFFLSNSASGQITYFNSSSNPADNAALASATVTVTPPGSMLQGDLVILVGQRRASNITLTISATGGQTWNALPVLTGTTNVSPRIFWCRFNGTWTANPSVAMTAASANTVVMHVFRPPGRNYSWAVDVAQATTAHASAATITRTGVTTTNGSTVTLAAWFTADVNQWGTPSAGWTTTGSGQYRNTQAGNSQSCTFAHQIRTTAGATGDVSKTQTSSGPDPTRSAIVTFYPYRTNMSAYVLE